MDEITIENYRCFREKQTARLAPLTLLVGDNSTGKTSFMAMVRALWDIAYRLRVPDFKEEPYDLGSFDEIAHHRGSRGGKADSFDAGFSISSRPSHRTRGAVSSGEHHRFEATFKKRGTAPVPVRTYNDYGKIWTEALFESGRPLLLRFGNSSGSWERRVPVELSRHSDLDESLMFLRVHSRIELYEHEEASEGSLRPMYGSPPLNQEDLERFRMVAFTPPRRGEQRPFASAPVRSKPRRTYDPSRPTPDPEGDYIPMYLANVFFRDKVTWEKLKKLLEDFGKRSGLFDEISIRQLGNRESEPFQVQIRRFGGGLKGPQRNLIDMGYGVSQVLPVITELLSSSVPSKFLLQQPEVHLHPSAQAALGSLFCQVASWDRQLVVETHSDHLIDRVRMDVRSGSSELRPDDVSILYFERDALDVHIHSLRIDEEGNILDAPDNYRQFFMEETQKSLGL